MGVSLSLLFVMALILAADMIPRMEILCRLTRPKAGPVRLQFSPLTAPLPGH